MAGIYPPLPENQKYVALVDCPDCGVEIRLIAEPDEWEEHELDGEKVLVPIGWGPGTGVCKKCNLLFADQPFSDQVDVYTFDPQRGEDGTRE